ncbi:MFS transporter [Streptomyces sparsogenes]|uniref:MFS transporter n=1 Tax=Streptomyces sparsogenes TaxID=67365 RepID=UPI00332A8AE8
MRAAVLSWPPLYSPRPRAQRCSSWQHDVGALLAARFLCGLGTGVFTATGTAALGEPAGAERTRLVSSVSTAANMGGLGLGTIVAGLFAQYGANPTHLVFWAYLAGLVPALVAVTVTPETVTSRQRPAMSVRRPAFPDRRAARTEFLRAATAVLAAFAVSGLCSRPGCGRARYRRSPPERSWRARASVSPSAAASRSPSGSPTRGAGRTCDDPRERTQPPSHHRGLSGRRTEWLCVPRSQ